MTETIQVTNKFPETYWVWRRFVALVALGNMILRCWFAEPPEYEIWAHVFLIAQWAIPALLEDLLKIWASKTKP